MQVSRIACWQVSRIAGCQVTLAGWPGAADVEVAARIEEWGWRRRLLRPHLLQPSVTSSCRPVTASVTGATSPPPDWWRLSSIRRSWIERYWINGRAEDRPRPPSSETGVFILFMRTPKSRTVPPLVLEVDFSVCSLTPDRLRLMEELSGLNGSALG